VAGATRPTADISSRADRPEVLKKEGVEN